LARNRKNQSAAIRFGPALKALFICLLIGGSGVGYVWQQNQLHELGRQKKQRELRLDELRSQNNQISRHLAELCSRNTLQVRVRELRLGLVIPQPAQIIHLKDPPAAPQTRAQTTSERSYAQRQSGDMGTQ
jgi:hypothetical protein